MYVLWPHMNWTRGSIFKLYISFFGREEGERVENYRKSLFCMISVQGKVWKETIFKQKCFLITFPTPNKNISNLTHSQFLLSQNLTSQLIIGIFLRVILYTERKDARTTLLSFGDKITSTGQTISEILTFQGHVSQKLILDTFHPFIALSHNYVGTYYYNFDILRKV